MRDISKKKVTIVRRDSGKKEEVGEGKVVKRVGELLEDIQDSLFRKAKKFLTSRIDKAKDMKELKKILKN